MSGGLEAAFLRSVFPPGVVCADIEDRGHAIALREAERHCIPAAGESASATSRWTGCAHRALPAARLDEDGFLVRIGAVQMRGRVFVSDDLVVTGVTIPAT